MHGKDQLLSFAEGLAHSLASRLLGAISTEQPAYNRRSS
jgi:hypothetical protein